MHILKLLFRNTLRRKLRTFLTVLGISIAILSFGLLRTVIHAWYAGVDAASASRLVTRNSISLVFSLPIAYRERIRQVEGVKVVSYGNWFGGIYINEKNFFPNLAVEPRSYIALFPEYVIPKDQKEAFLKDKKAFVAGRKVVEKYKWKIGDTVTLKGTIFPGDWEFVLRGIYYYGREKNADETQFFFHWDYLNETIRKTFPMRADQVGFYMIGVTNPNIHAEVAARIDKAFRNSLAETLTETEKSFQLGFVSMSEAIIIAIQLVSLVVIIIMAVATNTMAMTARERLGEYAVFKTLGFRSMHIAGLIFGESLLITMTGCLIGMILTFPAAKVFANAVGPLIPVFIVERKTLILDVVASLLVGSIAAIIPTWRAVHIRIADGLRRIG